MPTARVECVIKPTEKICSSMRFRLEHRLPRRLRYARVYVEAGPASLFFSLDGTSADWRATIGRRRSKARLTDREYSRLRARVPAVETLADDGRMLVVRNSRGYEERWLKPQWTLTHVRRARSQGEETE